MVAESWFRGLWKIPHKHDSGSQKAAIEVLAFEIAGLMSKLVHLWQSLSDKQVSKLREEITNSVGIKKLVSEDDDFIVRLICAEMMESVVHVGKSVARLGTKCSDPRLKGFEHVFDDMVKIGADPNGWVFSWKKMDKKVKKMEHFISVNASLYQEMEMLADLEQTVRRMKCNDPEPDNLLDYQKKLVWKRQEVKNLRDMSLWNKTYDYTIRFLARSLSTIYCRINHVFGIGPMVYPGHSKNLNSDHIYRSQSVSALLQSSVHPSENSSIPRFSSGPLSNFLPSSRPDSKSSNTNFYSGPLGSGSTTKSGPIAGKHRNLNFFSGPLGKPSTKVLNGAKESDIRNLPHSTPSILSSEKKFLNAVPETLGAAALALHYANVIVVIEKLAASPHLIGHDARDDLYNMLPASVRNALRARLKPYTKSLASSVYDTALAGEWTEAMSSILEWLAPLAHNMIRWQSERSFEQQNFLSRTNVLLVQTLYFANQEKTEATITELLVGLNYIWRYGRELNAKALRECASSRTFDEYLELDK
ncbi:hypothetical protein Tsubulata_034345 [Turnera subulata]|uniref:DUF668 domain-containing protein n=1 Tax=Turnera subulata TaxID=218843 RepID=A0A9Q0GN65_9ROSI|nr:hypothetical protein Tsubulata_034345 [Turnera subulata]